MEVKNEQESSFPPGPCVHLLFFDCWKRVNVLAASPIYDFALFDLGALHGKETVQNFLDQFGLDHFLRFDLLDPANFRSEPWATKAISSSTTSLVDDRFAKEDALLVEILDGWDPRNNQLNCVTSLTVCSRRTAEWDVLTNMREWIRSREQSTEVPPSDKDKKEAGFGINLVVAAHEKEVYFYNSSGVIGEPMKLKDLLKGCRMGRPQRSVLISVPLLLLTSSAAQEKPVEIKESLPKVVRASVPFYPDLARQTRIQGAVTLRVSTDGQRVSAVDAGNGPPLLVNAAKENVKTWQFEAHPPTSFEVKFRYRLLDSKCDSECKCGSEEKPSVVLHLPANVEVSAEVLMLCDPVMEMRHKS